MNPGVFFECFFDIVYLISVITIGFIMVFTKEANKQYTLLAYMCILLGLGDCFHLIPRIISKFVNESEKVTAAIGYGNAISSITMAFFYILFMELLAIRYNLKLTVIRPIVYILFACRVICILLPQNDWKHNSHDRTMSIIRNIPFIIIGIFIVYLLIAYATKKEDPLRLMWIFVCISFGCYIPVAIIHLGVPWDPILMVIKTLAYVAIVVVGFCGISPVDLKYD